MKKLYKKEVRIAIDQAKNSIPGILTESDMRPLPPVVQKYLRYTGVLGKQKVMNMRVECEGRIRSKAEDNWMVFSSEQYNFYHRPTRIFYINARKMGIPAVGLHLYKDEKAIMVIKLAGIFKVVDAKGPEMDQGETVTVFNGMRLPSFALTIYHRPDGDFCYGEFTIKRIEYNCEKLI